MYLEIKTRTNIGYVTDIEDQFCRPVEVKAKEYESEIDKTINLLTIKGFLYNPYETYHDTVVDILDSESGAAYSAGVDCIEKVFDTKPDKKGMREYVKFKDPVIDRFFQEDYLLIPARIFITNDIRNRVKDETFAQEYLEDIFYEMIQHLGIDIIIFSLENKFCKDIINSYERIFIAHKDEEATTFIIYRRD
jgi:hypothetical protein